MTDKPIFKVGDKVARLRKGKYEGSATISKITPTGKIRTDDNRLYDANGRLRTSDVYAWGDIQPWNERYEQISLKIEVGSLFGKVLPVLTLPQLRALKALLDGFKEGRNE